MALIRDLYKPDVVILPVGGKYTMGAREAGYAAYLLLPKYFLPIHFDTFPNQKADLSRVAEQIPMPESMLEQMPELMPKVMDRLMPHMIGDVVLLVTDPMIDYLRGRHRA
jgi:hypothetical protein